MTPLSSSQKKVLRARGLLIGLPLVVAALTADLLIFPGTPVPSGLVTGAALLVAAMLVLFTPDRRYRAWAYQMSEDELHVQNGIWVRTRTIVPFGRVQHIDVSQGPVERRYGVGAITLHTAGTRMSAVVLPGLEMEDAERMRDEIRGKIREDMA